jgi:hypothetical protein
MSGSAITQELAGLTRLSVMGCGNATVEAALTARDCSAPLV